jgi:hypothetical protein
VKPLGPADPIFTTFGTPIAGRCFKSWIRYDDWKQSIPDSYSDCIRGNASHRYIRWRGEDWKGHTRVTHSIDFATWPWLADRPACFVPDRYRRPQPRKTPH